jgi:chemotaxis protein CheX
MDAQLINPFISATTNALEMMAGITAVRGAPFVKGGFHAFADISGIIGLAGEVKGAVVLSFSQGLAIRIFEAMTGEALGADDPAAMADVVGELANMVAGGAKGALAEQGMTYRISVPTVVTGKEHFVSYKTDGPCLVVPFTVDEETFWVQISMNDSGD